MNNFDPTNNVSWQLGHRGRVAVFIDGNNSPDIQLSTDINKDRDQDNKSKTGKQLLCKGTGIIQKARPDSGSGHQESSTEYGRVFFHAANPVPFEKHREAFGCLYFQSLIAS